MPALKKNRKTDPDGFVAVIFKCKDSDLEAIDKAADKAGVKRSQFLRTAAVKAALGREYEAHYPGEQD